MRNLKPKPKIISQSNTQLSTLSNTANQKGWSDLLSQDLMGRFHAFLANLHVLKKSLKC